MTIHKITAPTDTTSRFGGVAIILGTGYTDRDEIAQAAAQRGYTVTTVSEIPSSHAAMAARLAAWPSQPSFGPIDGADPASAYRFTGPDGHTQFDVRELLSGVLTYTPGTGVIRRNGNPVA